jgi:hypothetical protein
MDTVQKPISSDYHSPLSEPFRINRLVVNHLFISWRILLALLVKFVALRLVIIMLVSSAYRCNMYVSCIGLHFDFQDESKYSAPRNTLLVNFEI